MNEDDGTVKNHSSPGPKVCQHDILRPQVGRAFRAGQLTEDQIRQLEEIPGMPKRLEKWKRLMMKKAHPGVSAEIARRKGMGNHGAPSPKNNGCLGDV